MEDGPDDQPTIPESPPGAGRAGGPSGCFAALLFAFPTASVVFLGVTMGDCALNRNCHQNDNEILLACLAVVFALAALFGLAIRVLVRRIRGTDPAPTLWMLILAIPVALILGLLAIWCELAILGFI